MVLCQDGILDPMPIPKQKSEYNFLIDWSNTLDLKTRAEHNKARALKVSSNGVGEDTAKGVKGHNDEDRCKLGTRQGTW